MKNLLFLLVLLIAGCTVTRYIYVVDDVYHSRPLQKQPTNQYAPMHRFPLITLPPYDHWRWQQYRRQPEKRVPPYVAPRIFNLESYKSEFAPPPPQNKKEEQKEEAKREAPVRKF